MEVFYPSPVSLLCILGNIVYNSQSNYGTDSPGGCPIRRFKDADRASRVALPRRPDRPLNGLAPDPLAVVSQHTPCMTSGLARGGLRPPSIPPVRPSRVSWRRRPGRPPGPGAGGPPRRRLRGRGTGAARHPELEDGSRAQPARHDGQARPGRPGLVEFEPGRAPPTPGPSSPSGARTWPGSH